MKADYQSCSAICELCGNSENIFYKYITPLQVYYYCTIHELNSHEKKKCHWCEKETQNNFGKIMNGHKEIGEVAFCDDCRALFDDTYEKIEKV